MARTKKQDHDPASTPSTSRKRNVKKKSISATSSVAHLQKITAESKRKFLRAKKTTDSYEGYTKRFKEWWEEMLAKDVDAEEMWRSRSNEGVVGEDEEKEIDHEDNMMKDPDFRDALKGRPTKHTPQVISMYIAFKCLEEDKGQSTAEGIHAALKAEYENM